MGGPVKTDRTGGLSRSTGTDVLTYADIMRSLKLRVLTTGQSLTWKFRIFSFYLAHKDLSRSLYIHETAMTVTQEQECKSSWTKVTLKHRWFVGHRPN
jgi:hypothetical protein